MDPRQPPSPLCILIPDKLEHARLVRIQHDYSCFITLLDSEFKTYDSGPLAKYTLSVKDNICTKGIPTTCASAMLADYKPPFNATVIERALSKGARIIGKTTMDTFGFGTFGTNVGKGMPVAKNPHDPLRVAGGSSSGSAVAVATIDNHISIAESTGGSISCPAAFCGVVGFTPTYGAVSRFGEIDYSSSLDKIGTMGKTVADAELLFEAIVGKDPREETTIDIEQKARSVKKLVIIKELLEGVDKGVLDNFWSSVKKMGLAYEEVSFPLIKHCMPIYYILAMAESSSNLAKLTGLRYGAQEEIKGSFNEYFTHIRSNYFSQEEKRRIILGTFVRTKGYSDKYYLKAQALKKQLEEEFAKLFSTHDLLVAPTMPIVAPRFDEVSQLTPVQVYALDALTIPPNLAGLPHLTVPNGKAKGMPTGMHIIGPKTADRTVLAFAKSVEGKL